MYIIKPWPMLQPLAILLAFLVLGAFWQTQCTATELHKKDLTTAGILNFRGAMLVKNGLETTCEFALIDNRAAFVSASCFDFSNGQLDTSTTYEIYFDQSKGYTPSKTSITKIHIHPSFDINSLANDVAIVEYNFTDQGNWVNYIAVYSEEWTDTLYVRRVLSDASSQSWRSPVFKVYDSNKSNCTSVSTIFGNNFSDMRCQNIQINSPWNSNCPLPYGTVYGVLSDTLAIAGLHSYSFMLSGDYCTGARGLYYYTLLMHYIEWGESIIGRQISQLVEDTNGFAGVAQSPSYSMKDASSYNPTGKYLFNSNVRTIALWNPNAAISSSTASSATSSANQPQSTSRSNTSDGHSSENSNGGDNASNSSDGNDSDDDSDNDNSGNSNDIIDGTISFINPADYTSIFTNPSDSIDPSSITTDSEDSSSIATGMDESGRNTMDGAAFNGLSKNAVIAIAVSVPIAFIIIAVAAFLLYKKWKSKRRVSGKWLPIYPKRQDTARSDIVEEIAGTVENDILPHYSDIEDTIRNSTLGEDRTSYRQSANRSSLFKDGF
ncbi:hypothetical protein BX070DRAFT_236891 [Coemansia spiralis]|nr:hypothetical protein BX070DRAFT_236891 [Coemansia spiralis]